MFINLSKADYIEQLHMSSQNVPFESIQTKYENLIKPIKNSINSYYNLIHNSSKIIDKFIIDSLHKIYDLQKETLLKSQIEFIKQYSNSYFSFYIFYNSVVNKTYRLSVDSILSIYSQFSDNIKQTPDGKRVLDSINRMQKLQINELMPDFLFRNITNDSYHLFQFKKSNYVLLCFWASWCIPCVENIPRLKSIDSLYGDKGLQLISISVDANKDLWIKSLEKYKMPWLQTCDLPEYVSKLKLHSLYNINWVPQYFLIDKKGILIYQNLQSKDDDSYSVLEKKLKEIFQYNENVK